jgi:hypothetical protein
MEEIERKSGDSFIVQEKDIGIKIKQIKVKDQDNSQAQYFDD